MVAQVSTLNYFRQNDYNEFTDDVPVTAQAGDVIKVDLFCTLGGEMVKRFDGSKTRSKGDKYMRYCIDPIAVYASCPLTVRKMSAASQSVAQDKGVLIRNIVIEGFVLGG